jgi:hypothetical protein
VDRFRYPVGAGRVVESALAALAVFAVTGVALAEEPQGELAALVIAGAEQTRFVAGGGVRAAHYWVEASGSPALGNLLGIEARFYAFYGKGAPGAAAHYLLGAAPGFGYQFGGLYRNSRGARLPSAVGLLAPEVGLWLRAAGKPRAYLGWRAPLVWLPGGDAGLEFTPAFVWAPAGGWLGLISCGGFLR